MQASHIATRTCLSWLWQLTVRAEGHNGQNEKQVRAEVVSEEAEEEAEEQTEDEQSNDAQSNSSTTTMRFQRLSVFGRRQHKEQ